MALSERRPPVCFRSREVEQELEQRAKEGESLGSVADTSLRRYYALLRRELSGVVRWLSEREACLLVDALNGTLLDENTVQLLWTEIDDAIMHDHLDEKWGLSVRQPDGELNAEAAGLFVMRLRELTPTQAMAVYDAVERTWRLLGSGQETDIYAAMRRTGLRNDTARTELTTERAGSADADRN